MSLSQTLYVTNYTPGKPGVKAVIDIYAGNTSVNWHICQFLSKVNETLSDSTRDVVFG